jgi:hypothetical protein
MGGNFLSPTSSHDCNCCSSLFQILFKRLFRDFREKVSHFILKSILGTHSWLLLSNCGWYSVFLLMVEKRMCGHKSRNQCSCSNESLSSCSVYWNFQWVSHSTGNQHWAWLVCIWKSSGTFSWDSDQLEIEVHWNWTLHMLSGLFFQEISWIPWKFLELWRTGFFFTGIIPIR